MELSPLPPGVRAETFTYADGKQDTIYLAPYESAGPLLRQENGARVLYYMYAAYVFRWPEGCTQLDVGHGSIEEHMSLFSGVTITGRWHPERLAQFGQAWARDEMCRYGG